MLRGLPAQVNAGPGQSLYRRRQRASRQLISDAAAESLCRVKLFKGPGHLFAILLTEVDPY
jgi:hypothetical protein